MINFREKIFGKSEKDIKDYALSKNNQASKEIMKILEMYDEGQGGESTRHWLDKATTHLKDIFDYSNSKLGVQSGLIKTETNDLSIYSGLGANYFQKIRSECQTPADYIEKIKNDLLKEKSGGVLKYFTYLGPPHKFISNEEYIKIFKYISLCLSGQLRPDRWRTFNQNTINVDYKKINPRVNSSSDIKDIVRECILNIMNRDNGII